jgi:hypothetical protein
VREAVGSAFAGHPGDGAEDVVTRVAGLPGSVRGAGAAGAGALAKLTGLGTAGKIAAVCLGTGAAATACAVTGLVPADLRGGETRTGSKPPAVERAVNTPAPAEAPPVQPPALPPASGEAPADDGVSQPAPEPEPEPPAPIAPSTPPGEQEFGVASAPVADGGGGSSSSGGGGSAVQKEFGP